MPAGIVGHFGPELRRFRLYQHHQGQVTVPRLVAQLTSLGLAISKRQVVRLLNAGQEAFLAEARDVLRAGLATAAWISVDDTGAHHQHRNAVCTQLGNDHFAAFATTSSKSRLNFLEALRAGYRNHVVNAEALACMRQRNLAGPVIAPLATHPERHFADQADGRRHLERLGITALAVTPDPVRIATGGSLQAHGLLPDTVILSDDAGQFALDRHTLCWVHAERPVHQLDTFTDRQHAAQQLVRALLWWFHADLKAGRRAPPNSSRRSLTCCEALPAKVVLRHHHGFTRMNARHLFAFSTWRIARIERPLVVLDTSSGRSRLIFTLRDLASNAALGTERIGLDADCPRWRCLRAALGEPELSAENVAELADAELDAALDPITGHLTYRAVPELAAMRADHVGGRV
jgi:hypothetical protein